MGVTIEQYRSRIGGFAGGKTVVCNDSTCNNQRVEAWIHINKQSVMLLIVITLLLVISGVEQNPGPGTGDGPAGGSNRGRTRGQHSVSRQRDGMATRATRNRGDVDPMINIQDTLLSMQEDILYLKTENNYLKNRVRILEDQSRKDNLIMFGLNETEKETKEDREELVKETISEHYNVPKENIKLKKTVRIGKFVKPTNRSDTDGNSAAETPNR